jgi:hypothetical protein
MSDHAAVGGTAQQDTRFVVAGVGESPASSLFVPDRSDVGFHFRRCRARDNEDFFNDTNSIPH